MVKVRPAPSHGVTTAKKRQRADEPDECYDSHDHFTKIHQRAEPTSRHQDLSHPERHVHFKRRLEQGPTVIRPERRSVSPKRSALRDAASTQLIGEEAVAAGLEGEYEEGNYDGADDDDDDDDDENVTDATPWGIEEVVFQSNEDGKGVQAFVNGEEVPLMDNEELHAHYVEMKRSRPYTSEKSPEAEYETDLHVCREMHELKDKAMVLANLLPNVPLRRGFLLWRFIESNEQAVRYIGSIAIGGKKGERSWEDLIRDRACRRALVLGLVGRALKEWVFDELWFGCLGEESQALEEADMDFLDDNDDGFMRTQERAADCGNLHSLEEENPDSSLRKQLMLKAKAKVTLQLSRLLLPLWNVGSTAPIVILPHLARSLLGTIVNQAAELSRFIRLQGDVIYYWPPTFKDEEFDPERMECLNLSATVRESPYQKKITNGREHVKLQPGSEDRREAIVRIVCFPELVAYRQGGGDLAARMLEEEKLETDDLPPDVRAQKRRKKEGPFRLTGEEGIRTRTICKSVVHLQWGKQRLLTREAGTAAHLDAKRDRDEAKYTEDRRNFKELHQIYQQAFPWGATAGRKLLFSPRH